jgi:hypothetical protein
VEVAHVAPAQQHDRDVRPEVETQVERVLHARRERFADRREDFAGRVAAQADPEEQPRHPPRADQDAAREAQRGAADHHRVVDPDVEEGRCRAAAEPGEAVHEMRPDQHEQRAQRDPDPAGGVDAGQRPAARAHRFGIGAERS